MNVRLSSTLRQYYNEIADLCRETAEPVFLTKNGKVDLVVMDIDTYNHNRSMIKLRTELYLVEENRFAGQKDCTLDELDPYLYRVIIGGEV